jgi:hypothetical protein
MNDKVDVVVNDPIEAASENRHDAVEAAIAQICSGPAQTDPLLRALNCSLAVDMLSKSVERCVILDNRPLDPARVLARHRAAFAMLHGESTPSEVA